MFGMGAQEIANAYFCSSIHFSISVFQISKHKNKDVSLERQSHSLNMNIVLLKVQLTCEIHSPSVAEAESMMRLQDNL